jgi:hypothetical protein
MALVTSRIQQIGVVKSFPLDKMNPDQARDLLCAILGDEVVEHEREMADRLAERCTYNPLALEIAARRALQESPVTSRPIQKYFEPGHRSTKDCPGPSPGPLKLITPTHRGFSSAHLAQVITIDNFHRPSRRFIRVT